MDNELPEEWPERIHVTKTISYSVEKMINQIREDNRDTGEELEITLDDVIEMIHEYAKDDFSCGWGHRVDVSDLVFQDESGEEY
jgi:hypothetical protein